MAKKNTAPFDFEAFLSGVKRPEREVQLCVDVAARVEIDSLIGELESLPTDDESLAGDPRRDEIVARLAELNADESIWTAFVVQAPTRSGRIKSVMTIAASEDDDRPDAVLDAEAELLADCLVAIGGQRVTLTVEQAGRMQHSMPDDLVQELVNAIREFGSDVGSVPFSQRLSHALETGTSSPS